MSLLAKHKASAHPPRLEGKEVLVLTPQSPMGRQIVGRKIGDSVEIALGRAVDRYKVVSAR